MRFRLTVQKPDRKPNVLGEFELGKNGAWEDIGTYSAEIRPLSALEQLRAKQAANDMTHDVLMRWIPELTPDCRLRLDTPGGKPRFFNIKSAIDRNELNAWWDITAIETVGE